MLPSDFTTMSFGELNRLPSKCVARAMMLPSCSVRVIRRPLCSQETSRPSRSTVLPLLLAEGSRNTDTTPLVSS